jgi:hypothetical protein
MSLKCSIAIEGKPEVFLFMGSLYFVHLPAVSDSDHVLAVPWRYQKPLR